MFLRKHFANTPKYFVYFAQNLAKVLLVIYLYHCGLSILYTLY